MSGGIDKAQRHCGKHPTLLCTGLSRHFTELVTRTESIRRTLVAYSRMIHSFLEILVRALSSDPPTVS